MSRLNEELKIIPRAVWILTILFGLAFLAGVFFLRILELDNDSPMKYAPVFFVGAFILVMFSVFLLLVGYIYGDAKRRGMRPILWALLAFFIPNAIGIVLYFILREPLLVSCPKCGKGVKPAFPYCPSCGESLGSTCPSCRYVVEQNWTHCAKCGAQLNATPAPLQ